MSSADFAAAQARLAARRQQRESEAQARAAARRDLHTSSSASRLPYPFNRVGTAALTAWDSVKGREGTRPAFRVGQVDAELLDEELLELLKGQVGEALKYYGSHLRDEYSAETLLALRAILFKLTIWDHNASYGASLQGLHYTDARDKSLARPPPKPWQKGVYGLVTVLGRYAWTKWEDFLIDREGGYDEPSPRIKRLSRLTSFLATTHSITAFVSFLVFLYNGRYRTLLDRVLRLRLAPTGSHTSREVSFEYLNRQLVWHAFTEFLLFLLPLVGISRWRRLLSRTWRRTKSLFRFSGGDHEDEDLKPGGELGFLPERTCAICYQDQNPTAISESEILASSGAASGGVIGSAQTDVTNPYEAIPCECVYCYVCLAQRIEAEEGEGWTCLRCGETVKECKPWSGDVLEEATSRPGTGKSVGFVEDKVPSKEEREELKDLEPMPVEDEKEAEVEQEVERDAESPEAQELDMSGDWTRASEIIEDTPSDDEQSEEYDEEENDEEEVPGFGGEAE